MYKRQARKHSRILMVGHLLQYHPAVVELRRWEDIILQKTAAAHSLTTLPARGDSARQPTV